ncbi:esterase-like activity of phytase family protein [Nonlabens sp. Asnod2-A12]|uniref:esterase-like activity of phytase family protein n=1 Tax=Nonlabens sp. Asnod2-A12 TaxID=3160578 RepID=UPI003867F271
MKIKFALRDSSFFKDIRMIQLVKTFFVFLILMMVVSCGNTTKLKPADTPISLRFIDEYVLPDTTIFENTRVGGLSGIDYGNGAWYAISDDTDLPRFYKMDISYNHKGFNSIALNELIKFKDSHGIVIPNGTVDPESIRYDNGNFVWTSEGNIKKGVKPFVHMVNSSGKLVKEIPLASRFLPSNQAGYGPHHNGVFEGVSLSLDKKGYWVAMELPLKEDGTEPTVEENNSPVRIAYINKETGRFEKEIVYALDKVERPAINGTTFEINGLVELVEYELNKFLVLERSYSMGYKDGGNTVKIYLVDATNATDVRDIKSLKGSNYTGVTKKLLFNFETIRAQLTNAVVDNIEGITLGPDFKNGNRSLVVVADNNFSLYGPQLNQFILFEIEQSIAN